MHFPEIFEACFIVAHAAAEIEIWFQPLKLTVNYYQANYSIS